MELWVAMYLLGPLLDLYRCLELVLQAGALAFMYQDAKITLDSLTREVLATAWHQHPTIDRPIWTLETSTDWWDRVVLGLRDDHQWIWNFRMRKRTFLTLCTWLTPALQRTATRLRAPIPVNKRVAIALWKLATPDSYRSVAHQFGVGRSNIGVIVIQVVHAINDVLLPRIIRLRDVDETMAGFAALGFPNCGGALDATHIAIRAPEHRAAHFMNRKGYCSIVLAENYSLHELPRVSPDSHSISLLLEKQLTSASYNTAAQSKSHGAEVILPHTH
nr:protein ALP1-like [Pelodiscus sinensis]|eukprot:XP_025045933.1 protein ALP1-like [Pelodiscus sinensis]